jgi:hypothetical protein
MWECMAVFLFDEGEQNQTDRYRRSVGSGIRNSLDHKV